MIFCYDEDSSRDLTNTTLAAISEIHDNNVPPTNSNESSSSSLFVDCENGGGSGKSNGNNRNKTNTRPTISTFTTTEKDSNDSDIIGMMDGNTTDVYNNNVTNDIILGPTTYAQYANRNRRTTRDEYYNHYQRNNTDHQRNRNVIEDELDVSIRNWEKGQYYNWRLHLPEGKRTNPIALFLWIQSGFIDNTTATTTQQEQPGNVTIIESDERRRSHLRTVATLIKLLREYYQLYGMPSQGGLNDQVYVLRTILQDLYAGGGPVWTLEKAMERGAEGLTGKKGVEVGILPRKAFIATSTNGMISMFRIQSGFNISRFAIAEQILVRIASFASNTHGFSNIPSRFPSQIELQRAYQSSDISMSLSSHQATTSTTATSNTDKREYMAKQILNLASYTEGLFYFINSSDRPDTSVHNKHRNSFTVNKNTVGIGLGDSYNSSTHTSSGTNSSGSSSCSYRSIRDPQNFWQIEEEISELFSRLATIEAIQMLKDAHKKNSIILYPKYIQLLFSFMASAGACAFWFHGGWIDIVVAGLCGFLVRIISGWSFLAKEDRIVFEALASVIVGVIAGLLSCFFPSKTCFVAMGLSGVLDVLQGFKVVYSIIEVMGKHTVAGSANFVEGLLYTTLIAFFLRIGQLFAESLTGMESSISECTGGIDEKWYILFVPLAAIAWSGLFNPEYYDLPSMGFHGVLAYIITWSCNRSGVNPQLALFLAAFGVTFSSGLLSRFTGRQAMGNTIAGLFVLVPGAYLVNALFSGLTYDFIGPVVVNAAIIGTGAWSGTIVCSPTIVGTTAARLRKGTGGSSNHNQNAAGPMLFF